MPSSNSPTHFEINPARNKVYFDQLKEAIRLGFHRNNKDANIAKAKFQKFFSKYMTPAKLGSMTPAQIRAYHQNPPSNKVPVSEAQEFMTSAEYGACMDSAKGTFDCSGFISAMQNHKAAIQAIATGKMPQVTAMLQSGAQPTLRSVKLNNFSLDDSLMQLFNEFKFEAKPLLPMPKVKFPKLEDKQFMPDGGRKADVAAFVKACDTALATWRQGTTDTYKKNLETNQQNQEALRDALMADIAVNYLLTPTPKGIYQSHAPIKQLETPAKMQERVAYLKKTGISGVPANVVAEYMGFLLEKRLFVQFGNLKNSVLAYVQKYVEAKYPMPQPPKLKEMEQAMHNPAALFSDMQPAAQQPYKFDKHAMQALNSYVLNDSFGHVDIAKSMNVAVQPLLKYPSFELPKIDTANAAGNRAQINHDIAKMVDNHQEYENQFEQVKQQNMDLNDENRLAVCKAVAKYVVENYFTVATPTGLFEGVNRFEDIENAKEQADRLRIMKVTDRYDQYSPRARIEWLESCMPGSKERIRTACAELAKLHYPTHQAPEMQQLNAHLTAIYNRINQQASAPPAEMKADEMGDILGMTDDQWQTAFVKMERDPTEMRMSTPETDVTSDREDDNYVGLSIEEMRDNASMGSREDNASMRQAPAFKALQEPAPQQPMARANPARRSPPRFSNATPYARPPRTSFGSQPLPTIVPRPPRSIAATRLRRHSHQEPGIGTSSAAIARQASSDALQRGMTGMTGMKKKPVARLLATPPSSAPLTRPKKNLSLKMGQ